MNLKALASQATAPPAAATSAPRRGTPARTCACRGGALPLAVLRAHACELVAQPLLLLAAVLVCGVAGTLLSAASAVAAEKLALQSAADSAAAAFASALTVAINPLLTVRSFIADAPADAAHSVAQAYFAAAAPHLVASSAAIACIQLAPYGHLAAIEPLITGAATAGTFLNLTGALGTIDLFNGAGTPNYRPAALLALSTRELVIQGPQKVFACVGSLCSASASPTLALIARMPIFVASQSANDSWAGNTTWPGAAPGVSFGPFSGATNCSGVTGANGASLCATDALGDGLRFWGFATILLSWQQLLDMSHVSTLGDQQQQSWSVSRLPDIFAGSTHGATPINVAEVALTNNAGKLPATPFSSGVVSVATIYSSNFAISLQLPGGWQPSFVVPGVAASVVLSVAAALALFLHLVERRLRFDLLFSMLPTRVVQRLASTSAASDALAFAERFDHVTVLFTDIVRFTDLVAIITPVDTMRMLNSLFLELDAITARAEYTNPRPRCAQKTNLLTNKPHPPTPPTHTHIHTHTAHLLLACWRSSPAEVVLGQVLSKTFLPLMAPWALS